ncbi:MAG: hypothetical protein DCF31_10160 [Alphaproteobacteria bacterium]|nr:MAG: hypothetical protein DCF31_10160 [Alphaproteobacteria bacterium]
MAGQYVRDIIAKHAFPEVSTNPVKLAASLTDLFETFFPDKKFLGPQASSEGVLSFPVFMRSGQSHDLDELSSGEKEILYGYLRMRNSAPRASIILLDEPELHLNPRLIRGLPEFYRRNLSEALDNQMWLITHSDALIRDAIGKPGFSVYHMSPAGIEAAGTNQLKTLTAAGLDLALADLIGDLAAYRPGGHAIIFEGGGDADFDRDLVGKLFEDELRGFNLISGSNNTKVRALHEVLENAYQSGHIRTKFFAVTDRDTPSKLGRPTGMDCFAWDRYHIENYIIETDIIASSEVALKFSRNRTERDVEEDLMAAARWATPKLIAHRLREHVNSRLVGAIDLKSNPADDSAAHGVVQAAQRSIDRIQALAGAELSAVSLEHERTRISSEVEGWFLDGSSRINIPGREILKRYAHVNAISGGYEALRNVAIDQMLRAGRKPDGMKAVISAITALRV